MSLLCFVFDQDLWTKGQRLHGENGCCKAEIESLIFFHGLGGSNALLDVNNIIR